MILLVGVFAFIEFVLLLMMITRTPALTFLIAGFTKRMVLFHPTEKKYANFIAAKAYGPLAQVKNRGLFIINPKHVYIEGVSKIPIAIVYGNFALSLDMRIAAAVKRLKEVGIVAGDQLADAFRELKEKGEKLTINLIGESVDAGDLIAYFRTSERSDLVEAEIQRRQANAILAKLKQPGEVIKWIIGAGIFLVLVSVAWGMFTSVTGGSNAGLAQDVAKQVVAQTQISVPTVGNTAAAGTGAVIT